MEQENSTDGKIREIFEEFLRDYALSPPYRECVSGCGLIKRFLAEWAKLGGEVMVKLMKEALIKAGENPDEWVILVVLGKPLPENTRLPDNYRGIKISVKTFG